MTQASPQENGQGVWDLGLVGEEMGRLAGESEVAQALWESCARDRSALRRSQLAESLGKIEQTARLARGLLALVEIKDGTGH